SAAKSASKKHGFTLIAGDKPIDGRTLGIDRTTPDDLGWGKGIADTLFKTIDRAAIDKATVGLRFTGKNGQRDPQLPLETASVARIAAETCQGWIVDLDTGRLLPLDQLAEHVPGGTFSATKMITIHMVAGQNDLGFIDTLGLMRLGLPELYVADVAASKQSIVADAVNATAQTLVNSGDLTRDGELDVDLASLPGDWGLDDVKKSGGSGKLAWKVRWSRGGDEDAHAGPFLELLISSSERGNPVALTAAISAFAGASEDSVHNLDFQPELDAAAVEARAALGKLRGHFAKEIPFNERLSIKAPFKTDHGNNEWMWVDVFSFKGEFLEGTLANTPDDVSALALGARLKVKFSDVADFIHRHADDTRTGGYSFEVMRKHGIDVPPLSEM
ncbi:MAG: DUF2314 domain-containing protein, partial [Myxococcales bacterium]|nr:DUF2314 domain-containing protein [Myxococcales bacterium]